MKGKKEKYYKVGRDGCITECEKHDPFCIGKEPGSVWQDSDSGFIGGIVSLRHEDGGLRGVRMMDCYAKVVD